MNEITGINAIVGTAWATPGYDRAGNMTSLPQPASPTSSYTAVYDAWNRLVKLFNASEQVQGYQYDGQNWRTVVDTYSGPGLAESRHFYYTSDWRVVQEQVAGSSEFNRTYVWGLRALDDLILREQ